MTIGLLVSDLCVVALAFSESFVVLAATLLILGVFRGALLTAARTDIAQRAPLGGLGSAMGTFTLMSMTGRGAGPVAFGAVVETSGIGTVLISAGGAGVAGALLIKTALGDRRGR